MGGPIYKCDDQTLHLIVEFLGKNLSNLMQLRETCTRFARVFGSCKVWVDAQKELEEEFHRYAGLCVGISNTMVSTKLWLCHESGLPLMSMARVRWISLTSSRLAIYLGSIPLPSPSMGFSVRASLKWLLPLELPSRLSLRNCIFVAGKTEVSILVHETMALLLPDSSIEGQRYRGAVMMGCTDVSHISNHRRSPRQEIPEERLIEYNSVAPSEQNRMVQRFGYSTLGDDRLVFVRQDKDNVDPMVRQRVKGLIFNMECRLNVDKVLDHLPPAQDFDEMRDTSLIHKSLLELPETAIQEETKN